ncbi:UNVERIFIED_CONTAM: hypothetical protein GTU68_001676 [Idotea baltica]|nr:hypothetical protein [Idotea baltica]
MALQCGIVGLPNVGKSTLFNSLSSARAQAENYPFCTIEPNVSVVTVPDPRLDKLAELVRPERIMPTTVEIVDIAGLVKGASKGEGLGNKFLGNIRSTNAIVHVVRCFDNDNVIHVDGSVDPVRDKEVIDTELQLTDLEVVERAIDKWAKAGKGGDKVAKATAETLRALAAHLGEGKSARLFTDVTDENRKSFIKPLDLLTDKPVIYVCNVDEESVLTGNEHVERLKDAVKDENAQVILISGAIEADINELDELEERLEFLKEYGLTEPGVNKLIRACYEILELITYFTAGVKEVRAWTVRKNSTAPQAAGVIHTDFERGFIRAEVIKYDEYAALGSEAAVKEAGKMNVEGKDYIVQDGDIMHFRFNV